MENPLPPSMSNACGPFGVCCFVLVKKSADFINFSFTMTAVWASHWLPFRPSNTVYSYFDYDTLPPVDASAFERYRTPEDVRMDPPLIAPNPLFDEWYFDLPGMFMRDHSFDINWSVDKYGRVVIPGGMVPHVVAPCMAEFMARMSIENSIWWSVTENGLRGLATDRGAAPERVWAILQIVLPEKQLAYLRPYYERARIWYTTVPHIKQE